MAPLSSGRGVPPDARTLYYLEGTQLIAADPGADERLVVEGRRDLPVQVTGILRGTHPGGLLLVAEPVHGAGRSRDEDPGPQVIAVTNWFTQWRERPSGR